MSDKLIDKLAMLDLQEKQAKRLLDYYYYDIEKRNKFYKQLKEVKKEIDYVKFKLQLEREMKKCK